MPTYEMPLLLRLANKAEYVTILKDVAKSIFETGGFIRKIENWGIKQLPCKTNIHNATHTHANHFMFCFDSPPSQIIKIQEDCRRNRSIIRVRIYTQNVPSENVKCTFEEEMLPPAYRPNVQKLLEQAKKHKRYQTKFKYNSGLDYYPFMR
ncbi:probable 28S ribosomal protein S6, mitochondrial [Apis dorsata]|uniref:probable 28S ribosomal protein S6, mitochondrial n=1 Tax=Apis dorsata TaxID=7462 RepID=UPI0003DF7513|nr:probable 28S ribosomal protein S6, mitochondrial [Apis dorsata]